MSDHSNIQSEVLQSQYNELRYNIRARPRWLRAADILELMTIFLSVVATVTTFITSSFQSPTLSIIAGTLGASSSALQLYARYAHKESLEREARINNILTDLGLRRVTFGATTEES
jgi:hypothetical protein